MSRLCQTHPAGCDTETLGMNVRKRIGKSSWDRYFYWWGAALYLPLSGPIVLSCCHWRQYVSESWAGFGMAWRASRRLLAHAASTSITLTSLREQPVLSLNPKTSKPIKTYLCGSTQQARNRLLNLPVYISSKNDTSWGVSTHNGLYGMEPTQRKRAIWKSGEFVSSA